MKEENMGSVSLIDGHIDDVPTCRLCGKPITNGRVFCRDCADEIFAIAEEKLKETEKERKND
jgi:predicted nucleic acid-binding Zn ribbon protein